MKRLTAAGILLLCFLWTSAQDYELKNTVEIYRDIQKLQRGLRVLYIAAHPDDENTRLISWLENDQHVETAYLSLTRGQGGQNLIGAEKGDALGVVRTYELLEARKVDGGEQFFTRAIDFGYSKSAKESFEFWGKDEVLHDVVYVIRKFRPHVIVTRFPATNYAGHGHHEASAILAEEAFDLAGDPKVYPEQLSVLSPWKPTALYHNTSSWWDESLDKLTDQELQDKKMHRVDVGGFDELRGMGMNEIAALARSKHRCQAFGTPRRRGQQYEYLQHLKGEWRDDFIATMPGIWQLSPSHAEAFKSVLDAYNFKQRDENLALIRRHILPKMVQRDMWAEPGDMEYVQDAVNDLKYGLSGLRVEVYSGQDPIVIGSAYDVTVEVYNSSGHSYEVQFKHGVIDTLLKVMAYSSYEWKEVLKAPLEPSTPFWLRRPYKGWLYNIDKRTEIGTAVQRDEVIPYMFRLEGQYIQGETEIHRRWNDRSIGEIVEPIQFVPPVSIKPSVSTIILREGQGVEMDFTVEAFEDVDDCSWRLRTGQFVSDGDGVFSLKKGQTTKSNWDVFKNIDATSNKLDFVVGIGGQNFDQTVEVIKYDHIPEIVMLSPASVKIVELDLQINDQLKLGYVPGSGDELLENLSNIGYDIQSLTLNDLSDKELASFDVIITGVRAYNRNEDLEANHERLLEFVAQGGKLIAMYNTTYDLKIQHVGPFDMNLSRNRVTDEGSDVKLLAPEHPAFNVPNKIEPADWTGWVQERGLYFAGEWNEKYTPLIAWNDEGEEPQTGGLLVAKYGNGTYIYSAISFFRQLPAGVPGAYKLMVNLIEF